MYVECTLNMLRLIYFYIHFSTHKRILILQIQNSPIICITTEVTINMIIVPLDYTVHVYKRSNPVDSFCAMKKSQEVRIVSS